MSRFFLAAVLTLTHATVIDVQTGHMTRDATLRIGSKIDRVVDCAGKFIIPALWDMHVHLPDDEVGKKYLSLFVANGVTGIRVMEGSRELYRWRDAIQRGEMSGPRMVVASAIIDGPSSYLPDAVKVANPAEARAAVRSAKTEGADFVKVYDNLSRAAYRAIIDEARKWKLPVAGHVPSSLAIAEVARAGQVTVEHMTGIRDTSAFATMRKHHTWECPTLIMRHNYAYLDDARLADDPRLQYVRPSTRERWLKMIGPVDAARKHIFAREQELVRAMAKAGVGILAGTDNGNPFVYPGFSIHDELALLVDSGLTPLQALQAATVNPAKMLHVQSSDVIILDGNPLDDIHNTKKIHAVVMRGEYVDNSK